MQSSSKKKLHPSDLTSKIIEQIRSHKLAENTSLGKGLQISKMLSRLLMNDTVFTLIFSPEYPLARVSVACKIQVSNDTVFVHISALNFSQKSKLKQK